MSLTSLPHWMDFTKILGLPYSEKGLSFLASFVGHPIKLHPNTKVYLRLDMAHVLVKIDLEKSLPHHLNLRNHLGETFDNAVSCRWISPRYQHWNKWGHDGQECDMPKEKSISPREKLVLPEMAIFPVTKGSQIWRSRKNLNRRIKRKATRMKNYLILPRTPIRHLNKKLI